MLQKKFDLDFFKYFSISFLASVVHLSTAWKNLPEPYMEQEVMKVCVNNFFLFQLKFYNYSNCHLVYRDRFTWSRLWKSAFLRIWESSVRNLLETVVWSQMKVCVNRKYYLTIDLLLAAEPKIPLPPLNPDKYLEIILCATNFGM